MSKFQNKKRNIRKSNPSLKGKNTINIPVKKPINMHSDLTKTENCDSVKSLTDSNKYFPGKKVSSKHLTGDKIGNQIVKRLKNTSRQIEHSKIMAQSHPRPNKNNITIPASNKNTKKSQLKYSKSKDSISSSKISKKSKDPSTVIISKYDSGKIQSNSDSKIEIPIMNKKETFNIGTLKKILQSNKLSAYGNASLSENSNEIHKKKKHKKLLHETFESKDISSNKPLEIIDDLRQKLMSQVQSANFRILNEHLYTSKSSDSFQFFKNDVEAFQAYHEGFASQVAQWPLNPLSLIVAWLRKKPRTWKVADFGCGDASLSKSVPQNVISLDLVASSPKVIECDMAHTPLLPKSMNVAVFCLSLMGTNISDFILEANRVLVERGILKIAEVESRFEDVNIFFREISKLGFKCINKNQENKFFWLFDFIKERDVSSNSTSSNLNLKPCIYRKR